MNIYLIEHTNIIYDANIAHVIVANNKMEVVERAMAMAADEGKEIWKSAKITEVGIYTGTNTAPFKLLSDFRNG